MLRQAALVSLAAALACLSPLAALDELNTKLEASSAKAVKWLIRAQNKNGSWGMDAKTNADVACTAISGLSLLAAGTTGREGGDPGTVEALKKAVDYLLMRTQKMKARGDIAQGENTQVHNYMGQNTHTFLTALFLSQVYGMQSPDFSEETYHEMRLAIQKLADTIAATQEKDGSWHKETYSSLQATGLAWLALRSAASAGVPIKGAAVDKTLEFIRKQYNPASRAYDGRNGGGNQIYATSSALRVLYGSGLRDNAQTTSAIDRFLQMMTKGDYGQSFLLNVGEDYPAAVLVTHALVQEGGERWAQWFNFLSAKLFKLQNGDGSWTTTSCLVGRTFATACALLCLQTPHRLLPVQDL